MDGVLPFLLRTPVRRGHDVPRRLYWAFLSHPRTFSFSAGPLGLLFEMGRGTQILWPHTPILALALPQLGSHKFFFLPISAMPLPQLLCHNFFFLPILAMALPQLVCHKFFFPYFGNTIATISLSQIFLTNDN